VQSSHKWAFTWSFIGALAVVALAGCAQPRDVQATDPPTRGDNAFSRQVDLDVGAIVAGMAMAHGARAVALRLQP
jgi:hypothetical protein